MRSGLFLPVRGWVSQSCKATERSDPGPDPSITRGDTWTPLASGLTVCPLPAEQVGPRMAGQEGDAAHEHQRRAEDALPR